VAEDLSKRQSTVCEPNAVWVSDIAYVPTDEVWLYLAGHKDPFAGEIVGYGAGERLIRNLVNQSLLQAANTRRPEKGLLHHSDRGSQYSSREYEDLLGQYGNVMPGWWQHETLAVHYWHQTPCPQTRLCIIPRPI
jgi:putative transposase